MGLTFVDAIAFVAFLATVIGISLYASREEDTSEDYFLAGRSLTWWLIGFSLIASNISTEHFIGMAGSGFGAAGLAIASYEWIAALSLVIVAFWLLPLFLRLGIFTMPEFLEHRYGNPARTIMAVYLMAAYVGVAIAGVLYSGALGLQTIFGLDLLPGIWLIGILAGAYTVYGGLKAVVWSDLLQGSALLIGGIVVTVIGLSEVGGLRSFLDTNADKLHMVLPADDPELPWTIFLLGIWIPNMFYWGFNQFITQRTLGARSLAAGQRGVIFAAGLKLIIPFIVVFPGIIAFQLYGSALADGDQAYPMLIRDLLPAGVRGLFFAALFGAVMSSLDSMLNSARRSSPWTSTRGTCARRPTLTGSCAWVGCRRRCSSSSGACSRRSPPASRVCTCTCSLSGASFPPPSPPSSSSVCWCHARRSPQRWAVCSSDR